ncbi:MAG: GTPase, partial [Candidatus Heimdallarchaeota archaeon]
KRVIVNEDGPTLTHGGMSFGAGTIAAQNHKAKLIDPKKYAVGSIKEVYKKFKHLGPILPAMGYSKQQLKELEETINKTPADYVVIGTPIRLNKLLKLNKPFVRVSYNFKDVKGDLKKAVNNWLDKL